MAAPVEPPPAYQEPVMPEPLTVEPPAVAPEAGPPPEYGPPEVAGLTATTDLDEEAVEMPPWEVDATPATPDGQPLAGDVDFPEGFTEGDGMMEQVRPEHVTVEDYRLPEEYQELMGQPDVSAAHTEITDEEEVVQGEVPEDVTVAPQEEPELESGTEWSFDESPAAETVEQEAAPPLTAEEPPTPETLSDEYVELAPEAEEDVTIEAEESAGEAPKQGSTSQEELHSFFFEKDVDKKGQEKKEDPDSFWD